MLVKFAILLCCVENLTAQAPYHVHVGVADGLRTNTVYDLAVDASGHLYLGTDLGVWRYNGSEFKLLPTVGSNSRAATDLQRGPDGRWYAHNFTGQLLTIHNDTVQPVKWVQTSGNVLSISFEGHNLVVLEEQLLRYTDISTGRQRVFPIPPLGICHISTPSRGTIIFTSKGVLSCFSGSITRGTELDDYKVSNLRMHAHQERVFAVARRTSNPFYLYEIKDNQINLFDSIYQPRPELTYHIASTDAGYLWICTKNGVWRYHIATKQAKLFFEGHGVSDVVRDYEGNYWVSTLNNGLFMIPDFNTTQIQPPALANRNEYPIALSPSPPTTPKGLMVGTTSGNLYHLSTQGQVIQAYDCGFKNGSEASFITYLPTYNRLVTAGSSAIPGTPAMRADFSGSRGMEQDHKGNLWAGNAYLSWYLPAHCVKKFSEQTKQNLGQVDIDTLGGSVLRHQRVRSLRYHPGTRNIWIAYNDGLYFYRVSDNTVTATEVRSPTHQPIYASAIATDSSDIIWVSTHEDGIYGISSNNRIVHHINHQQGLLSNRTRRLAVQGKQIWVVTDEGLEHINLSTTPPTVRHLSDEMGLHHVIINDLLLISDTLLLATSVGLLRCPSLPLSTQHAPRARITGLHTHQQYHLYPEGKITVPYSNNALSFHTEIIAFRSRHHHYHYSYQLKGIDDQWQRVEADVGGITYSALPAGTYSFQLVAVNTATGQQSALQQVTIEIPPPFWQQWWFVSLSLIALLSLIGTGARLLWLRYERRQAQTLRQQQLHQMTIESQLTALRAQMDPHFIYNALNSIQSFVFSQNPEQANQYFGKFADLMRLILHHSEKSYITVAQEIEALRLYLELEALRFSNQLHYSIEYPPESLVLDIPTMIVQPFVENALKHGLLHLSGHKQLHIKFSLAPHQLRILIDDNGIGRQRSIEINTRRNSKPKSFATQATTKRIQLINQQLPTHRHLQVTITDKLLSDGQPAGTAVLITIPIT